MHISSWHKDLPGSFKKRVAPTVLLNCCALTEEQGGDSASENLGWM